LTISIGILGATGFTGAELIRLLHGHPEARITYCSSRQYNGKSISEIFEFLKGSADFTLEEFDVSAIEKRCDVVFSCLPHGVSMGFIARIIDKVKVVDLSADFRLRDVSTYESWYQEHSTPALLGNAVYGLSEILPMRSGTPGSWPTPAATRPACCCRLIRC
jgi:N-acetyl-gamma-glutamyl-phosphate reductase